MPTESELRNALQGTTTPETRIDTDTVIRRARARRLPRIAAFGSLAVVSIAGITVVAAVAIPGLLPTARFAASTAESAADSAGAPEPATRPSEIGPSEIESGQNQAGTLADRYGIPVSAVSACDASYSEPVQAKSAVLALSVEIPGGTIASGDPVNATLTVRNTAETRVAGTMAGQPFLILTHNGVTVWHSQDLGDPLGQHIDLGPGESLSFQTSFTPVRCSPVLEPGIGGDANRPALSPGRYEVHAVVGFTHEAGRIIEVITGPATGILLR